MNRIPDFAALELTYRCNHLCIFCSCPWESDEKYRKDELSTVEWLHVIDVLLDHGIRALSLTGGEAVLREDLKAIISYIYDQGIPFNMISNGRAVDDDFLDFLLLLCSNLIHILGVIFNYFTFVKVL